MKKIGERINEFLHWVAPSRKYVYYFNEGSADEKGKFLSVLRS
jgi:hypothetical protein